VLDLVALVQDKGFAITRKDTQFSGHARDIAFNEDLSGFHALATVGGDGTLHEVVNGMLMRAMCGRLSLDAAPSIAVIPCGSGNTFAYDLGITSVDDAIKNLLRFRLRRVDVLELSAPTDSSFTSLRYGHADAAGGVVESKPAADSKLPEVRAAVEPVVEPAAAAAETKADDVVDGGPTTVNVDVDELPTAPADVSLTNQTLLADVATGLSEKPLESTECVIALPRACSRCLFKHYSLFHCLAGLASSSRSTLQALACPMLC
jgi:hypothetical protein